MNTFWVIAVTAVIFLAMIVQLAGKPSITAKVTGTLLVITGVGGLCLYGYGFSSLFDNPALAVIRTLWAVIGMYMGRNEVSAIAGLPLFQKPLFLVLLWLMHVFAVYTLASAAITTVGKNALKALRLMLARRGRLILICGTDADSLAFGRRCASEKETSVVFVSDSADGGAVNAVQAMGASLRADKAAIHPDRTFLRSIGVKPGSRAIRIFCLGSDESKNLRFARELKQAMETAGIGSEQTSLTIAGEAEAISMQLQASPESYGFGFVHAFRRSDLTARLMIEKCPPWEQLSFREDCRAAEDFEALIIGFGQIGQSVLRYLIMNGQYEGSHFSATVLCKDPDCQSGLMRVNMPEMFEKYSVSFLQADARGKSMYDWLDAHRASLRYIAVCTADENLNQEIAADLLRYKELSGISPAIVRCSYSGIRLQKDLQTPVQHWPLFSTDTLLSEKQDRKAVLLNHLYNVREGRTPWEDWVCCSSFSRMSSRASADFSPAMLRAAGVSEQEAAEGGFRPTEEQLENLGRTEHLRWCAFHYCFGYRTMSDAEFTAREAQYLAEVRENGTSRLTIGKNPAARTHACLIPWEELDSLSARVGAATGRPVNYKAMDKQNVNFIPQLIKEI